MYVLYLYAICHFNEVIYIPPSLQLAVQKGEKHTVNIVKILRRMLQTFDTASSVTHLGGRLLSVIIELS